MNKWLDEARLCNKHNLYESISPEIPDPEENKAFCSDESLFIKRNTDSKIYLEEYEFTASENDRVKDIAEKLGDLLHVDRLKNKLVIINDNAFHDFVTMSTEVITRTKINNETGAVQEGALFTEEYLPSETVMYSMVLFSPTFLPNNNQNKECKNLTGDEVKAAFFHIMSSNNETVLQIGAGATIGKGITQINWEV